MVSFTLEYVVPLQPEQLPEAVVLPPTFPEPAAQVARVAQSAPPVEYVVPLHPVQPVPTIPRLLPRWPLTSSSVI